MHIRALPLLIAAIASTLALTNALTVTFYPCDNNSDRSGVVVSDLDCDEDRLRFGKFWKQSNADWLAPPNQCITPAEQKIQYSIAQNYLNRANACENVNDAIYETKRFFSCRAGCQCGRCRFSVQGRRNRGDQAALRAWFD